MTLKHLPPTFCWTKIGTESGEELPTVVLRKEWERRLGGGRFLWGINQPLGSSAQVAAHRTGSLLALFSPVASRVRPGERKRADALLWNAWIDASGQVRPLRLIRSSPAARRCRRAGAANSTTRSYAHRRPR